MHMLTNWLDTKPKPSRRRRRSLAKHTVVVVVYHHHNRIESDDPAAAVEWRKVYNDLIIRLSSDYYQRRDEMRSDLDDELSYWRSI